MGRTFLNMTPVAEAIEEKIVILDYIKIVKLW